MTLCQVLLATPGFFSGSHFCSLLPLAPGWQLADEAGEAEACWAMRTMGQLAASTTTRLAAIKYPLGHRCAVSRIAAARATVRMMEPFMLVLSLIK